MKGITLAGCLGVLIQLVVYAGLAYVAFHFLMKVW